MTVEIVAQELEWPEGPVWLDDGSIILVETAAGRIVRVRPDGSRDIVATPGGGPNGGAIGPDGALYVCNNGGMICHNIGGQLFTSGDAPLDYETGRIERVDLASGEVKRLYDSVDARKLAGPNDIVFDSHGGFWFSDIGKREGYRSADGGIFYATTDGTRINRVIDRLGANGIGISPDGTELYVALTFQRQILAFDIVSPGVLNLGSMIPGRVVANFPGRQYLDSLAVSQDGRICVGVCLEQPGIASVDPLSGEYERIALPDLAPTNICFGGADMRDAWVTFSAGGKLAKLRWATPGLKLAYHA